MVDLPSFTPGEWRNWKSWNVLIEFCYGGNWMDIGMYSQWSSVEVISLLYISDDKQCTFGTRYWTKGLFMWFCVYEPCRTETCQTSRVLQKTNFVCCIYLCSLPFILLQPHFPKQTILFVNTSSFMCQCGVLALCRGWDVWIWKMLHNLWYGPWLVSNAYVFKNTYVSNVGHKWPVTELGMNSLAINSIVD